MLNKRFLEKVSSFITAKRLLSRSGRHIVALSGGADSVTLALTLKSLGYNVEAAHCNFHLRGEESDRDERFCISFCKENDIKLHIVHFDTKSYATLHKVSIEMAARKLRYAYFEQLRTDIGADTICVAHHKDDTVETVIMNLIRGTGIHGLMGIAPVNGHIVRPLLCVYRHEIENFLSQAAQQYVTDSTNLEDDVVRNKIRLNILPMMRTVNPSVSESIAATAERIAEAAKVFDSAIEADVDCAVERRPDGALIISTDRLMKAAASEYVLYTILKSYDFTPAQAEMVFKSLGSGTGSVFTSATHQLLIDRGRLILERLNHNRQRVMKIPEPGVYVYDEGMKLRVQLVSAEGFKMVKDTRCACLDASCVSFPLTVRPVEAGDRFTPFGMRGSKLVSDYLTDRKMTLFDKRRQLVVTDSTGRIVWLVNERPDNRCRITESTRQVMLITIQ